MIAAKCRHVVVAIIVSVAGAGTALAQTGIAADPAVGTVTLSTFQGLSQREVWQQIDGLAFWAVPRNPPAGYYQAADATRSECRLCECTLSARSL